ncbi:MAG: hypothetical protein HKO56_02875 [Bacteroidia bacterium]|nr:hypothetical protein [Bacteroidia bacterium]NNC86344.1 hypothetical protein [Bacteroidia bacterium]NNM15577.1 hypothetical protein [Bacteroidia bacterium]
MATIKSDTTDIPQSPKQVFDFVADLNNLESLMPKEVEEWKSDVDSCEFTLKGMARLGMTIKERNETSLVQLENTDVSPFPFTLNCNIESTDDDNTSKVNMVLDAELNPMLSMLATKPLTNFLNILIENYKKQCTA